MERRTADQRDLTKLEVPGVPHHMTDVDGDRGQEIPVHTIHSYANLAAKLGSDDAMAPLNAQAASTYLRTFIESLGLNVGNRSQWRLFSIETLH